MTLRPIYSSHMAGYQVILKSAGICEPGSAMGFDPLDVCYPLADEHVAVFCGKFRCRQDRGGSFVKRRRCLAGTGKKERAHARSRLAGVW